MCVFTTDIVYCVCMDACMQTHWHPEENIHTGSQSNKHTQPGSHTVWHTYTITGMQACTHTYDHKHTYRCTWAYMPATGSYTYIHTFIRTHIHTSYLQAITTIGIHIHAYIHKCMQAAGMHTHIACQTYIHTVRHTTSYNTCTKYI